MPDPCLLWLRRDLRLADHPALCEAISRGAPVIPIYIRDDSVTRLGAAPALRLELGLAALQSELEALGARLILRTGDALEVLNELVAETGAGAVHWQRLYDPAAIRRDSAVKTGLSEAGVTARSFAGHLLFEPWQVETGQGSYYKVYSPFWKAVRGRDPGAPLAAPSSWPAPEDWPDSERLEDWQLSAPMRRGRSVVASHVRAGSSAAMAQLDSFVADRIDRYGAERDFPDRPATSDLSHHLTVGEISARQCWQAGWRALEEGKAGAETFLKELVWREFAYHLMYHTPHILEQSWRDGWEAFPWQADEDARVLAWKQGRTGVPLVDAAMRELFVTGRMHNRARMITASYLTKHLLVHWRIGQAWFEDCLVDWDPASNAMGWQWVAGCGPDASPYFRIFNPETQAEKFDPEALYRHRWLAEGQAKPSPEALQFYEAAPLSWDLSPEDAVPAPLVGLKEGREKALEAYEVVRSG
ncbi:deoxyribodipyrimidine photo-lyase [Pseudooceanicola antarcticus]|uniref:Deoxyribodipyrimidine photo-lyase n=1 Tax=Pseudooceanicola antarcticus TaxID=1247613 RepID=A0A285IYC2_9RHOB|nr:deoxyribodipyrimidine photo-lyase [Pseudooceanicola antarcticus]PJE25737.1 deoxyribodipyrimidine photo-lyase [Pseudooceanicola antarcticus]SNY53049.1 deoxyribodipyrimidine photo-lyase [Pseudooceanicola antarcticus]